MISYNTKDWFTYILRIHKGDTIRALFPIMMAIGAYAGIIGYLEVEYLKITKESYVSNHY